MQSALRGNTKGKHLNFTQESYSQFSLNCPQDDTNPAILYLFYISKDTIKVKLFLFCVIFSVCLSCG